MSPLDILLYSLVVAFGLLINGFVVVLIVAIIKSVKPSESRRVRRPKESDNASLL